MTCPEPAQLERLFQGQLAPAERASLEQHLDACEHCAGLVSALARLFASASWGRATSDRRGDAADSGEGFGRYRVLRRLGAGAMGVVFEAFDTQLERRVALKLLHVHEPNALEPTRARLLQEARAMARLADPHVVAVYDVGRVDEQLCLAMELVEGPTLRRWLAAAPRTQAERLAACVGAGRGLAAAHGVGLVHRDFKPDNVLVGHDGRARVTDFGLAAAGLELASASMLDLTATLRLIDSSRGHTLAAGEIVGTPAYMAPEQWRGELADARSDQFAFCVALHEALFGYRPFAGEQLDVLRDEVLAGRRVAMPRRAPRWLRALLERGLDGDPARRHVDMAALLGQLERDRRGARQLVTVIGALGLGTTLGAMLFVDARDGSDAAA